MRKGKKASEETKRKMREVWRKRLINPNFIPPRTGKKHPHSEETKRKISIGNRGKICSEKSKKLMKKNASRYWLGKHYSKEHIEKLRLIRIGTKRSDKTKKKMSIAAFNAWKKGRHKLTPLNSNTKPELKIQNFLKRLNIKFLTHQYMKIEHDYQVDIFVPSLNLVIECDGNYWHYLPKEKYEEFDTNPRCKKNAGETWKIDDIRTKELIKRGFKVLRLVDLDINEMNLVKFKGILKKKII